MPYMWGIDNLYSKALFIAYNKLSSMFTLWTY